MPNKIVFQTDDDQQDTRAAGGFISGPNSNLVNRTGKYLGVCQQVIGPMLDYKDVFSGEDDIIVLLLLFENLY